MPQTMTNLYVFTTNGDTSSSDFLGDPFLPLNIAGASDQYDNIQLAAIFGNNGVTCPFYSGVHSEQLFNAATVAQAQALNTLTFYVPANHSDAQYVTEGNLVAFRDLDGNFQLFEIMRTDDYHADTLYREVYCIAAGQSDLTDDWISNVSITNASAQTALSQVLDGTQWMVGQVDDLGVQSLNLARMNVLAGIAQLVTTWGGEICFRVELSGKSIAGMYVDWLQRRGSDTGKRFVYGKDVQNVQKTSDKSNVKTALWGYGKADSNQQPLTFTDVEWSKANGDPVDKPAGQGWVGDPTALATWGRKNGTIHLFGSFTDTSQSDPVLLLQATWNRLQTLTSPLVSYQTGVVDLERITGYSHEAVRLGDTAATIDTEFVPELRLQARVLQIDRDLLDPLNTAITLGNFLPTTASQSVQVNNLHQTITNMQTSSLQAGDNIQASWLVGIMDLLKAQIQSDASYVYVTNTDGILVLDAPMDQNPTSAIKLGGGIFGIADSKDAEGNWNWTTFGTGKGFVANLITTGTLIGVGVQLGGLDNGNGQFTLLDNDGNVIITMDNTGIKLSNGATMLGGSGVLSTLVFISSGDISGWQKCGWWDNGGTIYNEEGFLFAYIPNNFVIESATLYTKIMPVYWDDTAGGGGTGWTSISQARLSAGTDPSGYYSAPLNSEFDLVIGGMADISTAEWGGDWTPDATTHNISVKSADVTSHLSAGHRTAFGVNSANASSSSGYALVQLELVVTGYKNG